MMVGLVLKDLLEWSGIVLHQDLKVYHVHQLFYHLTKQMPSKGLRNELLAEDKITSDIYNYTTGMGCKFHDAIDKPRFCSLNIVKRWAFLIMDECCPELGLEQKPDTHRHVDKPTYVQRNLGYKEEIFVPWLPSGEMAPVTSEPDRDVFDAPMTRANPAGFVNLDGSAMVPNPNKMSRKERQQFEVNFSKIE